MPVTETVLIGSTASDTRWPEFCEDARRHGIVSTFSVPLHVEGTHFGAVNSYAEVSGSFDLRSK